MNYAKKAVALLRENGYSQSEISQFENIIFPISEETESLIKNKAPFKKIYDSYFEDTAFTYRWVGEKDPDCDY